MKKHAISGLLLTLGAGAVSLWGADFWTAKPFTEWSEKDALKMIQSSPWAKEYSIAMPGSGGGGGDSSGKSKKGAGGDTMAQDTGGMGAGINLVIRWQTALPVKQANAKLKYKGEAGTSDEAKKLLDSTTPDYLLVVEGLNRSMVRGETEEVKKMLMDQTALLIKGREPIKPVDFRLTGAGMRMTAVFAFPKTVPITVDEKEVEFDCKVGIITIKQKFTLKAMVFNDKLEM
jgi:hypothetical protein